MNFSLLFTACVAPVAIVPLGRVQLVLSSDFHMCMKTYLYTKIPLTLYPRRAAETTQIFFRDNDLAMRNVADL
jgi:hypothetical protein